MSTENERRHAARKSAHFVAEIETAGLRIGCGISRDASARGLLLLARTALASRTEIVIHLRVPGEEAPRALKASVVRWETIPPGDSALWTHKIGVLLEAPPADLEQVIDRLVKPTSP
jgi:PilZ domain-containing protein